MNRRTNNLTYEQTPLIKTKICNLEVNFISKQGLPNWNIVTPSQTLIAQEVKLSPGDRTLWLGCGHGASAVYLSVVNEKSELWVHDQNFIALKMLKQNLLSNSLENIHLHPQIELCDPEIGNFDNVIIDLPKGRQLFRRWLMQAWEALRSGGHFYLAGPNDQGIQSVIKDAQTVFGEYAILGYKKGCRIARFSKTQYVLNGADWLNQPGIRPHSWATVDFLLNDIRFQLFSLPGIFSYDHLDPGTRLLLENVEISNDAVILDVGCGYGVIGIYSALTGANRVDLVDSNLLAIAAAQKNVKKYELNHINVIASDVLSEVQDQRYSLILTNPPFHAGKAVEYQLAKAFIEQSYFHLLPHGRFVLVANQFIRYEKLMEPLFSEVNRIASADGYILWQAIKS